MAILIIDSALVWTFFPFQIARVWREQGSGCVWKVTPVFIIRIPLQAVQWVRSTFFIFGLIVSKKFLAAKWAWVFLGFIREIEILALAILLGLSDTQNFWSWIFDVNWNPNNVVLGVICFGIPGRHRKDY